MKEIGEKLKETRESMGISIEEAAEDLKLKPSQLENIEDGNREAFDDIFYLKYFIRDYSKYLGLDYEEMVEEKPNDVEIQTTFNEDSMDVLCEDAEVENENKEGE